MRFRHIYCYYYNITNFHVIVKCFYINVIMRTYLAESGRIELPTLLRADDLADRFLDQPDTFQFQFL